MPHITLQSPAKLNLFLKVNKKRKDGFHDIVTLFERIDLCDELTFSSQKGSQILLSCDHPQVPLGNKNLVYKMIQLIRNDYNISFGLKVKIKKRIPVAAGLAGGSSNAATTLFACHKIWKLNLSPKMMIYYAGLIGSDVPFFVHNCSWAIGQGRGDEVTAIKTRTKLWHVLIVPKIKIHTKRVYETLKLQLTKPRDDVSILIHNIKKYNINDKKLPLVNDLERVIFQILPRLKKIKEKLKLYNTQGVVTSGSGPAIYCVTKTKNEAEKIKTAFSKHFTQVYIVKTV